MTREAPKGNPRPQQEVLLKKVVSKQAREHTNKQIHIDDVININFDFDFMNILEDKSDRDPGFGILPWLLLWFRLW